MASVAERQGVERFRRHFDNPPVRQVRAVEQFHISPVRRLVIGGYDHRRAVDRIERPSRNAGKGDGFEQLVAGTVDDVQQRAMEIADVKFGAVRRYAECLATDGQRNATGNFLRCNIHDHDDRIFLRREIDRIAVWRGGKKMPRHFQVDRPLDFPGVGIDNEYAPIGIDCDPDLAVPVGHQRMRPGIECQIDVPGECEIPEIDHAQSIVRCIGPVILVAIQRHKGIVAG